MENTKRLYINPTIEKQVRNYCEINGIDDVNAFVNRCALQGLNILKYGTSPIDNVNRENAKKRKYFYVGRDVNVPPKKIFILVFQGLRGLSTDFVLTNLPELWYS